MEKSVLFQGNKYRNKGDFESALTCYRQFFIESAIIKKHQRTRLTFCISYWVGLSEKFPKARTELLNQKKLSLLLFYETKIKRYFEEFAYISYYLGEKELVLDEFFRLHDNNKKIAKSVFSAVYGVLVEKREWNICSEYVNDFPRRLNKMFEFYDMSMRIDSSEYRSHKHIESLKESLVPLLFILKLASEDEYLNYLVKLKQEFKYRNLNAIYHEIIAMDANTIKMQQLYVAM